MLCFCRPRIVEARRWGWTACSCGRRRRPGLSTTSSRSTPSRSSPCRSCNMRWARCWSSVTWSSKRSPTCAPSWLRPRRRRWHPPGTPPALPYPLRFGRATGSPEFASVENYTPRRTSPFPGVAAIVTAANSSPRVARLPVSYKILASAPRLPPAKSLPVPPAQLPLPPLVPVLPFKRNPRLRVNFGTF